MDRVGVDAAILIGCDGYDFLAFMRRLESLPADFMGGRAYTRGWAAKFPGRLHYVTTLYDWRAHKSIELRKPRAWRRRPPTSRAASRLNQC